MSEPHGIWRKLPFLRGRSHHVQVGDTDLGGITAATINSRFFGAVRRNRSSAFGW